MYVCLYVCMYVYFGYGKVSVSCVIVENNLYS